VVTSIISVGSPVTLGTVLYAVESKPVVAMSGALPAWRTLKVGVADGPDVQQLELSLVALGYDRSTTMKVDQHFDNNTKAAVERWQAGYGLAVTGNVTLGSVVFLPSASTVSAVQSKIGAAIGEGDKVLSLAASNQDVVINVPTGDESFVVPGFAVKVGNVDGTVSLLRSATQNGTTVVEAVITPTAPITGGANGATVKVTIQHDGLTGVLLVPAAALASRLDGSYAVQVVGAAGNATWVPVEVLATANGNVAIRGTGITDGTKVLQPR
jgi:peptidoglycan hydrolase-like protein with peptidoglycan-binding domain